MQLADTFIQNSFFTFCSLGIKPMMFALLARMLTSCGTETLEKKHLSDLLIIQYNFS